MRKPCLKQLVRCVIVREDGTRYEATNTCDVVGSECARVIHGCKTGEGYELCGSVHAEANVAKLAEETKHIPGVAHLFGHDWACRDCQHVLAEVNVNTITIHREAEK